MSVSYSEFYNVVNIDLRTEKDFNFSNLKENENGTMIIDNKIQQNYGNNSFLTFLRLTFSRLETLS